MTRKFLRTLLPVSAAFALVLTIALAANAQASSPQSTVNIDTPITLGVFVPCAAGGAGEFVLLNGTLHELFHLSFDNAGGANLNEHFQPQGLSGTGLTTGAKYQGTGVTDTHDVFPASTGLSETFVNNFRMIGQGPGNNFMVHENEHLTVTPNGTISTFHDNFSVTCN